MHQSKTKVPIKIKIAPKKIAVIQQKKPIIIKHKIVIKPAVKAPIAPLKIKVKSVVPAPPPKIPVAHANIQLSPLDERIKALEKSKDNTKDQSKSPKKE